MLIGPSMDIDYVPEALGAIQDVHITLTSLLVAEADIVGLIEQLDVQSCASSGRFVPEQISNLDWKL